MFHESQAVMLKPARAAAYGFERTAVYTLRRIYNPRPNYRTLWAELTDSTGEFVGQVKLSELKTF